MSEQQQPLIHLEDVSKIFYTEEIETHALSKVSFEIFPKEYVSIEGPSGCGKSTLLSILGLLDTPTNGAYSLNGRSVDKLNSTERAHIRNKEVGFIFQSFNLLSKLTAEANVELPLIYQRMGISERRKRVINALERVGLADRSGHKPTELSGGQQQRVAIARALVTNPSLLLADEPTGNLDSQTGADIIRLFHELHESGNTIILITHDANVSRQAGRQVQILDGMTKEAS